MYKTARRYIMLQTDEEKVEKESIDPSDTSSQALMREMSTLMGNQGQPAFV